MIDVESVTLCGAPPRNTSLGWGAGFFVSHATVKVFEGDVVVLDTFAGDDIYAAPDEVEIDCVGVAMSFHMIKIAFLYPQGFRRDQTACKLWKPKKTLIVLRFIIGPYQEETLDSGKQFQVSENRG